MKKSVMAVIALLVLTACEHTTVRCGPGTLASPDGVNPDGSGFMVNQDGTDYRDGKNKLYKNVTCKAVPENPVVCGPNMAPGPAQGAQFNPDGGGLFINQDGSGLMVNQDGTVPMQVCVNVVPAEPAPTPP
jgi:hypothetical protein